MKPTRATVPVAVLAVAAMTMTGCSSGGSATSSSGSSGGSGSAQTDTKPSSFAAGTQMEAIQKRGKLIVGVKDDFPLFGIRNPVSGKLEGMDIEIAQQLAKALTGSADNIQYVVVNSDNREAFLQQHKVDVVIATYPPNPKRIKKVDFAGPYLMSPISTMVRKDYNKINSTNDLSGKNICVTTGSTVETLLPKDVPGAKVVSLGTITDCMQALEQNRVDGVTTTESLLLGLMSQNPGKFKIANGNLLKDGKPHTDNDSIGLPKGEKAFHDYLDTFLKDLGTSGEWKKIYDNTIGKVSGDKNATPPPIIY